MKHKPELKKPGSNGHGTLPRAYTIAPDGTIKQYLPANGKKFTLEELQKAVGGYIEIIHRTNLAQGTLMLVDEDGRLKGRFTVNTSATMIAGREIVGTVLILPRSMMN